MAEQPAHPDMELASKTADEYGALFDADPTSANLLRLSATLFHVVARLWIVAAARRIGTPARGQFGWLATQIAEQAWQSIAKGDKAPRRGN